LQPLLRSEFASSSSLGGVKAGGTTVWQMSPEIENTDIQKTPSPTDPQVLESAWGPQTHFSVRKRFDFRTLTLGS
jgi:hypothetical protein